MLALRDCNYLWFADLFMNLMLFHGCSTSSSPTTSMSTPTPPGNIYTHLNAQSPQQASGDSGVALQSGIKRISLHLSTTGNGQSSSNASAEDSSSSSAQYSAHFPSLSSSSSVNTKSLPLPLPLDVSKQSKLEERLGAGGEVKQVFYSPPFATVRSSNPSTAAGTPATGSSAGSGGYKGKGAPRRPLPSSQQQHSPMYHPHASATSSSSDAYEAPSAHFGGALQFFFRFIVTMNNHRFNHSLLECVLAEVSALLRNDNFAAASSVNFEITSPEKSKGLPISLPSDKTSSSSARRTESNWDFFISPEDFALKVTKLKLLGRFLGLLHFYHHWAETAAAGKDIGPLQKLALRLAEKRSFLHETLPVLRLLQQSRRSRTLSLTVPWACEFLMMMSYDAACLAYVLPSDKQTVAATDTHSDVIPYFDVLAFLHEVQYGPQLQPLGSKLTSNRYVPLFYLGFVV